MALLPFGISFLNDIIAVFFASMFAWVLTGVVNYHWFDEGRWVYAGALSGALGGVLIGVEITSPTAILLQILLQVVIGASLGALIGAWAGAWAWTGSEIIRFFRRSYTFLILAGFSLGGLGLGVLTSLPFRTLL